MCKSYNNLTLVPGTRFEVHHWSQDLRIFYEIIGSAETERGIEYIENLSDVNIMFFQSISCLISN